MAPQLLNVVLCWHMHQPYYREGKNGDFHLPWVYLHGIKDYTDMAVHLQNHPTMEAVVNFSPVLLEQLDDYVQELDAFFNKSVEKSKTLSDPLLATLAGERPIPQEAAARYQLYEDCKRCYAPRMIEPYSVYDRLMQCLNGLLDETASANLEEHFLLRYLDEQYFIDILVWYHLAWLGHSLRDTHIAQDLMQKGQNFTLEDRRALTGLIHQALAEIIPSYKALADSGQIELSFTPYAHPIIPLLNSFQNMECSLPDSPGPECEDYPNGEARSRWHMEKGIRVFEHYFERKPNGVWLSEGGVSADALDQLHDLGLNWTASGEQVWRNTCQLAECPTEDMDNKRALFRPYQYQDNSTRMFFRDDGLSDFIGFEYSHWNAIDAARHFVKNLTNIAEFLGEDAHNHVVPVILDGENAWEYYLDNGYHFLDDLYREMTDCEAINITTFNQSAAQVAAAHVDKLCAGSWVYGSFSTWIGEADKNRAWEYLVAAKKTCDDAQLRQDYSVEKLAELDEQLAICEGSDWFWWFGDYNASNSVHDFDALFRTQLKKLYYLIDNPSPEYLEHPISHGGGNAENSGTMRRNV
ncbi:MAG: Amylopullulanase (EC / (EC [uncultured Thiotrichaceae bacterium]|uniref:Amylopullulanase ) n=1 Tax=uncultured Thiotrichaceae bacterium TaxID=298394 RepID=A0A6S6UGV1_9GAMM|nr:MAG: Amylopullulanase (EC / (EC [uncultured Thiotrichaceae bacterium]